MSVHKHNFIGFSHEEAEEIRLQAISFWETATRAQIQLFDMVNDCERVARVQLPKRLADKFANIDDMAQLVPPDVYINLRSQVAGLFKLLFARKPWGRLSIEGKPNDRTERIKKAEWLLQSQLDVQNEGRGYESEAVQALYQVLYAGITCTYTHWAKRYERKIERDESGRVLFDKNKNFVYRQEVVDEYAETKHVDIRRVRFDPSVDDLDEIRIWGYQAVTQFSKLQVLNRNESTFYNFDEKELQKTTFDRDQYYEYVDGEANAYPERGGENDDFGDKLVEKWEIRGLFRANKRDGSFDLRDLVVVIANKNMLVGLKANDLPIAGWDIVDFPYISPESSRVFRMGLVEPMMDQLVELFIKRNQSIDEANHSTHGMFIADAAAAANLEDYIEEERGRVIKIDTQSAGLSDVSQAFREFPRSSSNQDTFNQAAALSEELKQGMFRNDYLTGTNPSRDETATGVSALVSGGTAILELTLFLLKNSMFAPNWRKTLILYNFFKGEQENVINDAQGNEIRIEPGDLEYFFKIDIDVAAAVDHPAMVRRFVETYPTMIGDPYWDQYEIRNTLKDVLQLPNGDRLLPPSQYLQDIIERENIALTNGLGIFVSEFDPHSTHIEGHVQGRDLAVREGLQTQAYDQHIEEHQAAQEAQQEGKSGIGNTKQFGGNAGQNLSSENAANKSIPGQGQQRRAVG